MAVRPDENSVRCSLVARNVLFRYICTWKGLKQKCAEAKDQKGVFYVKYVHVVPDWSINCIMLFP